MPDVIHCPKPFRPGRPSRSRTPSISQQRRSPNLPNGRRTPSMDLSQRHALDELLGILSSSKQPASPSSPVHSRAMFTTAKIWNGMARAAAASPTQHWQPRRSPLEPSSSAAYPLPCWPHSPPPVRSATAGLPSNCQAWFPTVETTGQLSQLPVEAMGEQAPGRPLEQVWAREHALQQVALVPLPPNADDHLL